MSGLELASIHRYPLKSARGHTLREGVMDRCGLEGDRRWMLVDDTGRFVSQRRLPALACLDVQPFDGGIKLLFGDETIAVEEPSPRGECVITTVWEDTVVAPLAAAAANQWVSERLGESLRLVHFPPNALRGVEPGYAPSSQLIAFSDGYPLLLLTEASLEALNERLPQAVPMDRFRPNLVIRGTEAHAEDRWRRIRIGAEDVQLVKPCSRCAIPGIDQQTGERDPAINRVLATYRRRDGIIYFGMNGVAKNGARFRVGDPVEVIDEDG